MKSENFINFTNDEINLIKEYKNVEENNIAYILRFLKGVKVEKATINEFIRLLKQYDYKYFYDEPYNDMLKIYAKIKKEDFTKFSENVNEEIKKIEKYNFIKSQSNYKEIIREANDKKNHIKNHIPKSIEKVLRTKIFPRASINQILRDNMQFLIKYAPIFVSTIQEAVVDLPLELELFDYIIFDEASQIKYENTLSLLARAKKYITVGDKQQMGPINRFIKNIEIEDNDEDYDEEGIQSLIDKSTSNKVLLNTIYRAQSRDLMLISNKYFYNNELEIIENMYSKKNPFELYNVHGDILEKINEKELKKIEKIVKKNKDIKYGVILFNKLSVEKLEEKNLDVEFIRNIDNIQGVEADEIIIGMTYNITNNNQSLGEVNKLQFKNALNVLFSRAKKKIIVVTSYESKDIISNNENLLIIKDFLQLVENKTKKGVEETNRENEISKYLKEILSCLSLEKRYTINYNVGMKRYYMMIALYDNESKHYVFGINLINSNSLALEYDKQKYFKSRDWEFVNFSADDLLENFLDKFKFILNDKKIKFEQKELVFRSSFEEEVYTSLEKYLYNYILSPNALIGHYEYDLIILNNDLHKLLVIEIDGEEFHNDKKSLLNDENKEIILKEEYKLPIYRITSKTWSDDSQKVIINIKNIVEERNDKYNN